MELKSTITEIKNSPDSTADLCSKKKKIRKLKDKSIENIQSEEEKEKIMRNTNRA
jgi:hypothetical protein